MGQHTGSSIFGIRALWSRIWRRWDPGFNNSLIQIIHRPRYIAASESHGGASSASFCWGILVKDGSQFHITCPKKSNTNLVCDSSRRSLKFESISSRRERLVQTWACLTNEELYLNFLPQSVQAFEQAVEEILSNVFSLNGRFTNLSCWATVFKLWSTFCTKLEQFVQALEDSTGPHNP